MTVVQRCPSCGTTQAAAGECTTCREAQVRYFCTTHASWLSGPTCPQCAAPPPMPMPRPARAPAPIRAPPVPPPVRVAPPETWPVLARDADVRPALWESVVRGAEIARRSSTSVTRASAWLSRLVLRLAMIAVLLGIGLVALINFAARSLG